MTMKEKNVLLFDLAGTLTDPGEGITNSVRYALKKFGIEVSDRKELYRFIGPPLAWGFETFYGFSPFDAQKAVEAYREYYCDRGIWENRLYPGIPFLLSSLAQAGKILLMATSKPEPLAVQIAEHFEIADSFSVIAGSELDGRRTDKAEVIRYALACGKVCTTDRAVMIGDREYDIIGAKKTGLSSVGVLYGYGSETELKEAGADRIVKTVSDLKFLFL